MIFLNITIVIIIISLIILIIYKIHSIKNDYENYISQLEEKNASNQEEIDKLQFKIQNTKCILCNELSNGKHFCYSCYSKYKNRTFDLRIKNLKGLKIVDDYGNKTEVCEDGRYVRSRAEQCIANYFYNNKIRYAYEKPIFYNGKILKPDFFLPDYDIYIEYNELKDEQYLKKKEFALQIYKKMGINIVVMTQEDRENIYEYFCKLLQIK